MSKRYDHIGLKSWVALIRRAQQGTDRLIAKLALDTTLTPRQIEILLVVADNPGCTAVSISTMLDLEKGTTSDVIRRLKDQSLVTVAPDTIDTRAKKITLTKRGARQADKARQINAEANDKIASLTKGDIITSLDKIARLVEDGA